MKDVKTEKSKSQKRVDRQRRREERRKLRNGAKDANVQNELPEIPKKKKSLPGFLAKYRKEIDIWLRHYMTLFCNAEDANIPYFKEMSREERNKVIQEYVDVSEFRTQLDEYLKEEELKRNDASKASS